MKRRANFSKLLEGLKQGDKLDIEFKHEGKNVNEKTLRSLASKYKCSVSKDWDNELFVVIKDK